MSEKVFIIPSKRVRYLSEISESNRGYDQWSKEQKGIAEKLYALKTSIDIISNKETVNKLRKEHTLSNTRNAISKGWINL